MSKDNVDKKDSKKRKNTNKRNNSAAKKESTNDKMTKKNNKTNTKANNRKKDNFKEEKKEVKKVNIDLEEIDDEEFYYDDDLEDFYDEEDEVEEVVVNKAKVEKKDEKKINKKEEKKIKEKENVNISKIKKVEKMAKKNNKAKKNNNTTDKVSEIGYFLDNNRNVILAFIIGVILTVVVAFIIWPERIATLKNGEQPVVKVAGKTYTADNLYKQMKDHYSVSQLLDKVDDDILSRKYPEDDAMKKEVESTAENYINMYKQYYNYTEEQFLSANGFSSRDAYLDYLKLDNRRKKYEKEYVEKNLTDKEIEKYYNDNVYGEIKCEHVLVEVASDDTSTTKSSKSNKLKDADAKKLAQEIIDKINDGTSWKDIQKEYKDKVTYENLGYQAWDSDLESTFKDALKKMDDKSYSEEPVKTSYGYHVIYRETQKKTPTLKQAKSKIIDKLVDEKIQADSNMLYKAMISLRDEKKIKFSDTDMKAKYETYKKQYNK